MKSWAWLALGLACLAGTAQAADYRALRTLNAPPPTRVEPLPEGAKPQALQFVRVVAQPKNGEAWAIAYTSIAIRAEGDTSPVYKMMAWTSGRVQEQSAAYKRVFDEELKKAGFASNGADGVFSDVTDGGSANLKVGVLIDDIQGRFCVDCPNLFNRSGIPATVMMNANWEVYSSIDRKVIFKATTHGGADSKEKVGASVLPAVYEGFRENVRQLLANPDFRKLVTASSGLAGTSVAQPPISGEPARQMISLLTAKIGPTVAKASGSVALIFANDGSGSGFLASDDGYLITNHHVVGASKYVKLKWPDGTETLGEVIRSDPRRDVALVKTDRGTRLALALRHTQAQPSETVFAIGSPMGDRYQNTLSKGIVSALRTEGGLNFIQSDVMINHGSSGGPLLDEKGNVIGLAVSGQIANGAPVGLNFFIPIDDALKALSLSPAG